MVTSFSPAQLERFRREAKNLGRELSIKHCDALDRIAVQHGFTNWSLLAKHSNITSVPVMAIKPPPVSGSLRVRYYLHGDVIEGELGKYYCARCDLFEDLSHFQPINWHKDGDDGERFLSSLANWNKLTPSEKGRRYRPSNAANILQQAAESAQVAREESRSPFHLWLEGQRGRNDPIGDLAQDALDDKDFPRSASTRREMEDYLSRYGDHIIRALQQALHEYQASLK